MVKMGRLDICMKVSAMSSFVSMPREGNFQQLLHMFAYLKIRHNAHIVLDMSYPEIDEEDFKKKYWGDVYGNDPDTVPSNIPMPLGSEFIMRDYVKKAFARCKVIRQSSTGFIIFLNSSHIF